MQSDPRSNLRMRKSLSDYLYYSTLDIKIIRKQLRKFVFAKNRYSKKKSIVNNKNIIFRSNPNGARESTIFRTRRGKIREKNEGRVFIMIKKKRTNLFIRRAWVVACVADVLACPAPVPTSWRRPWIHRIRWSPAYNTKPQKRFPDLPRKRWLRPLRCPRRRCTATEFGARDSPRFARNIRTVGTLPN